MFGINKSADKYCEKLDKEQEDAVKRLRASRERMKELINAAIKKVDQPSLNA